MDFGARLKAARRQKGLSQTQAADALRTDQRQISKYESGKQEPSASRLREFCILYGVSSDWLLGLEKPEADARREGN